MQTKVLVFLLVLTALMTIPLLAHTQVDNQDQEKSTSPYPLGGPIPILYACGEPYARGLQLGQQLYAFSPNLLRDSVERGLQFLQLRALRGRYPDREKLKKRFEFFLSAVRERMGAEVVDEFLEEMRGIAEGAKVNPLELMLAKWGNQFSNWDEKPSLPDEEGSIKPGRQEKWPLQCSSIAVWGKATRDGRMLAAHNCDGQRMVVQLMPPVATVLAPERGNVLVYAALSGTLGGHHIVSHCLFVNGTALPPPKEKEPNLCVIGGPHGILRRWLCQYSETAAAARTKLQGMGGLGDQGQFPPASTVNLVDAGNAIFLLCAGKRTWVLPNQDGLSCVANHFCLESLKEWFDDKAEKESPFYLQLRESSRNRRQALQHHTREHYGQIDIDVLKNIMASHYDIQTGKANRKGHTICQHGEERGRAGGTVMSTLVDFKAQKVYLALGNPCAHGYTEIPIPTQEEVQRFTKKRMAQIASREKIDFFSPIGNEKGRAISPPKRGEKNP